MVRSGALGAARASKGARTSLGSQCGEGAPTHRPAHLGALHGYPSHKWVPHRAVGLPVLPVLSTTWPWLLVGCRRGGWLRFRAPSCAHTHKQVPTEGKWQVLAAAGAPSQQ